MSLDAGAVFHDVLDEFRQNDLVVANLECPLSAPKNPITKTGKNFHCEPDISPALKKAGFDLLNLGNNHILDQDVEGLYETIRRLDNVGIKHVGVGEDLRSSFRIHIETVNDIRVGFLSMAESEFSIATNTRAGAAPIDLHQAQNQIQNHQNKFDHLIVLLHAGAEHYPYPSPNLQSTCRALVEYGASAVICQHSHCPGTFEVYQDALIVYGQGNFYSPSPYFKNVEWHQGLIVQLSFSTEDPSFPLTYNFIPTYQDYGTTGVRLMTEAESEPFLKALDERTIVLQNPADIKNLWLKRCQEQETQYLCRLMGYGKILSRLERTFHFTRSLLGPKRVATLLNLIRCETHRESLLTLFQTYYDEMASKQEGNL